MKCLIAAFNSVSVLSSPFSQKLDVFETKREKRENLN